MSNTKNKAYNEKRQNITVAGIFYEVIGKVNTGPKGHDIV